MTKQPSSTIKSTLHEIILGVYLVGSKLRKFFLYTMYVILTVLILAGGKYLYQYVRLELAIKEASKINPEVWSKKYKDQEIKPSYKMNIITEGVGDWQIGKEMVKACDNIGWVCKNTYSAYPIEQDFNPDIIFLMAYTVMNDVINKINPDALYGANLFYYYTHPVKKLFGLRDKRLNKLKHTFNFAKGFLAPDDKFAIFDKLAKQYSDKLTFATFYPTYSSTEFQDLNYSKLFFAGTNGDKIRGSKKFKELYNKLAEENYISFYGPKSSWGGNEAYKGFAKNIKEAIKDNGIYLLIHGEKHILDNIPSGRIFEAIANSTVIISDRNQFIVDHFGDNILYFDHNASAEAMFKEIQKHYKWIKSNPKIAKEMAKSCHDIFLEKFTMEKQLEKLAKISEYIKAKK